jgi:programmed cell death 6-interacting protein
MILFATKRADNLDLLTPILTIMRETSGSQVTTQVKTTLQRLQVLRNNLSDISVIRNNSPTAVKEVTERIKEYLSMWNCILRCFTFGEDKESINVHFEWYDAYTNDKKSSSNPMIERVGMLYNLGVMYSQMGADLVNSPENKVKEAANTFLIAAWIFDRIKLDLVNIQLKEFSLDLSESNLSMCSYLMKAQAQSCAYERVRAIRTDKPDLITKLAMQASKDYEVANGYSKIVGLTGTANEKNAATIIQFKENAFRCRAYYWSAIELKKKCEQTIIGMGKAVASIRKAVECVNAMKIKERSYTAELMGEYKALCAQCADAQRDIENQNHKFYHESVPLHPPEIDPMPFGKPISIEAELEKSFEGKENFSLRIPPGVRTLENEYRKEVGMIIQEALEMAREMEEWRLQLLRKHNLPSSIHAVSNEQKIPDDVWLRIRKCKENGGFGGLSQMLDGVQELAKCNEINILEIYTQLKEEEKIDAELRQKYGAKWIRLPSANLNINMLKQLEHHKQKFDQEKQSNMSIKEFGISMKKRFEVFELDRDSLTNKIPKSNPTAGGLSPAATKYIQH